MAPRKDIEATLNTYGNYGKNDITGSGVVNSRNHPYNVTGRAGKGYEAVYVVPDGQSDYTGSRSPISGVQVVTHGDAVLHLTGGGTVAASLIANDATSISEITPLSIAKVTAADSATIRLFRGQGI